MGQGAYILGCEDTVLTASESVFFREADPWGFILFARNLRDPQQIKRLTSDLRNSVGRDAPVLIDQEGGRVQRMGAPHWSTWEPPLDVMTRLGPDAGARAMELRSGLIAAELRACGIDTNCVPCADVARPETHAVLRNRTYGADPKVVTAVSQAVIRGTLLGGCLPVVKHMPGHGLAQVDSHLDLPRVSADAETLIATDFAPFAALNSAPLGMTAHLVFEAFDPDRPATQSPVMIDLIRATLGFSGLLMTDDISMEALDGDVAERGTRALAAGCDLVLHCNGDMADMETLVGAVGKMTQPAQSRAEAALMARPGPPDLDPNLDLDGLRAEFNALTKDPAHG